MNATITTKTQRRIARAFLERKGYELLTDAAEDELVGVDPEDGSLAFVRLLGPAPDGGFAETPTNPRARTERERTAILYLSEHSEVADARVRFDALATVIVGEARCLIRHHVDALGSG